MPEKRKTVVVALGGNAITQTGQRGTTEEQLANISNCCDFIADLAACGYGVVLTHGNGPQVGNLLIQNECGRAKVPENPMDVCVAQTQGSLGYLIAQTLQNRIRARGMDREVAAIMTQVVVDPEDPAFRSPSKPVGPFFTEEEARTQGHPMVEDSGRGYRRVVPSPRPKALAERDVLKLLVDAGVIVIAVGGGGIPVTEQQGGLHGAEAVVDKDFASALVAKEIGADSLMLLTGVPKVAIHFGTPASAGAGSDDRGPGAAVYGGGPVPRRQHGAQDSGRHGLCQRRRGRGHRDLPGAGLRGNGRQNRHQNCGLTGNEREKTKQFQEVMNYDGCWSVSSSHGGSR